MAPVGTTSASVSISRLTATRTNWPGVRISSSLANVAFS